MLIKEELKSVGFTEGEIKVYLSLLSIGKSSVGPITKGSGVSPSKVYDILNRLIRKGAASYVIKGKTKRYSIVSPKNMISFIKEERKKINDQFDSQEKTLSKILPELEKIRQSKEKDEYAEIFEGIRGIKAFFDLSLEECKKGGEVKVVGYSKLASQLFNAYFKEYNKNRAKKRISAKVIFNYGAWFGKKREKRELAYYKYLPKKLETPAFIFLFKDRVGTITISEKQKMCFMIKNKEVANSYEKYFELMWKTASSTSYSDAKNIK